MRYTFIIKKNNTLKYILKKGKYMILNHIVIHFINNNKNYNCFAVCVSKKNGNSVKRNKLKRWSREVYKNEEIFLRKGLSIIILYKKDALVNKLDYSIINNEIKQGFKGLDLYYEKKDKNM